ncbi:lipoyl(octanoyl) transferase LipB [Aureimonas fodinaquatilis]|uniref:Octanoyltransferase n=1 Tax=Aureimonas fodinaquatilis TaxID=2565783 RepID=A0A5B0DZ78_9HYPH|nr:lipoyl(octanoyl) transferase LipB [Aureimonas fodinaquatilis]KAA0970850.1 lipoyl(octanoyl) transferase LipB [Aureimonas fodinaquatilis]
MDDHQTSLHSARLNTLPVTFLPLQESAPVRWLIRDGLTQYQDSLAFMEKTVAEIAAGTAPETVLLLEHPPLYTSGTSAHAADLTEPNRFPVYEAGRGGEYTYHGPGQRVAYVMLDLKRRNPDIRAFVSALEQWIIRTLADFQIRGERREERVGVWVSRPERPATANGMPAEDKVAAIGIRLRRWVTFHGISLNIDPDLSHFSGIIPCGVRDFGVTSLTDLGILASTAEVDIALRRNFEAIFGATETSTE